MQNKTSTASDIAKPNINTKLIAIAAVDEKWGIAKNGNLLAHLPGDLAYFKENTLGNVLIMGRRTIESLPGGKPLPKRHTIIMTVKNRNEIELRSSGNYRVCCACNFSEIDEIMEEWKADGVVDGEVTVFVAGGEMIYSQLFENCSEYWITMIEHDFDADQFFPNMDEVLLRGEVEQVNVSEPIFENGYTYRFIKYRRK